MNESQKALCAALKAVMWGETPETDPKTPWQEVLEEAKAQAVTLLFEDRLEKFSMPREIYDAWKDWNSQQYTYNMRVLYEQEAFRKGMEEAKIPFLILKGCAAAVYYPNPILRIMGDVDIILKKEKIDNARAWMTEAGYAFLNPKEEKPREYQYSQNDIVFELHNSFAILNSREADTSLDGWIYDAVDRAVEKRIDEYVFPVLDEELNGLVLLAHIDHHLEEGLGLRQIIDWIMYVKQRLKDDQWETFWEKTEQLGMTKLAKASARIGQLYLGLPEEGYSWCMDTDSELCENLMDYIFECGNFGLKGGKNNSVTMIMSHGKGIGGFFRNLQKRGEANWNALRIYSWLRPMAWIYQAGRYARKGIHYRISMKELRQDAEASRRRNTLMEQLGATQLAKRDQN